MEALIFFLAGVATGAAANSHTHETGTVRSGSVEVPLYDNCDTFENDDVYRLGNFIITRDQRTESQHLSGLNFFRDKYGKNAFNMCYDFLVTGD